MFPMINTPWGRIELYYAAQAVGAVVAVAVQMIMLYRAFRDIRSLLFSALYGLYSGIGGLFSSLVRVLSYTELDGSLLENIVGDRGKHFLGTVIIAALLAVPCTLLLHKALYRERRDWKKDMVFVTNALAAGLLIQHMFGRFGCFSRGCCYGIPYTGIFSTTFPYASVSYSVFPSQLFEIIGAGVLLIAVFCLIHWKKPAFSAMLCGFSLLIFLSEIWIDKRGTTMYYHLTVIQWFAVALFCIGAALTALYCRSRKKEKGSGRG